MERNRRASLHDRSSRRTTRATTSRQQHHPKIHHPAVLPQPTNHPILHVHQRLHRIRKPRKKPPSNHRIQQNNRRHMLHDKIQFRQRRTRHISTKTTPIWALQNQSSIKNDYLKPQKCVSKLPWKRIFIIILLVLSPLVS